MPTPTIPSARSRPTPPCRWRGPATILALWLCLGQGLAADPEGADPDTVFAAFVYNFCLFTRWPDLGFDTAQEHPLVIVTMGRPLPALDRLAGRTVRKHPIRVVSLAANERLPDECHVLVCSDLAAPRRAAVLARAAERPILTIASQPGFCEAGGILEFFVVDERMRFRIDQARMKHAGIQIHSHLLKLAEPLSSQKRED